MAQEFLDNPEKRQAYERLAQGTDDFAKLPTSKSDAIRLFSSALILQKANLLAMSQARGDPYRTEFVPISISKV